MNRKMDYKPSRFARTEGSRMMKQTGVLVVLTIVILFLLIKFGIPAIVNMAVFLGDLKASNQPIGQEDVIAPAPPILDQLPQATASASFSLQGYTEALTTVKLFRSGSELVTTVATDAGDFTFSDIDLIDGANEFYVVAQDESGNVSDHSNRVSILYDIKPPELALSSPTDGQKVYGEAKRTIEVKGITDPGSNVRVNNYYAVVSGDGSFSSRIKLEEGENTVTVIASDEAENQTQQQIKVSYAP